MHKQISSYLLPAAFVFLNQLAASAAPVAPMQTSPLINGHVVLGKSIGIGHYVSTAPRVVLVDKGSHTTYVLQLQHGKMVRVLSVPNAIGKGSTPTPPGRYTVLMKKRYPEWIPPKSIDPKQKIIPPYNITHKNPLGVAAIYLSKPGIMLHGTNAPWMLKKSVSHGCIRHSNKDITRLFGMVRTGTPVYISSHFAGNVINFEDLEGAANQ